MSDKLKNILILSSIFELLHIVITNPKNSLYLILGYIVCLMILLIKKEFKPFNKFKEKFPKISNYFIHMGWLWFISLAAMILFNIFECSDIDEDCLKLLTKVTKYMFYTYVAIAAMMFGYASSISFTRKK